MPMECTDTVTVSEWVTWKNWESPLSFKLHPASTRGQTHTTGLQSNMLLLLTNTATTLQVQTAKKTCNDVYIIYMC